MKWSGTFYQASFILQIFYSIYLYLRGKIALKVIIIVLVDIFQVFKTQRLQAKNSLIDYKEKYEDCNHFLLNC